MVRRQNSDDSIKSMKSSIIGAWGDLEWDYRCMKESYIGLVCGEDLRKCGISGQKNRIRKIVLAYVHFHFQLMKKELYFTFSCATPRLK